MGVLQKKPHEPVFRALSPTLLKKLSKNCYVLHQLLPNDVFDSCADLAQKSEKRLTTPSC